MLLLKRFVVAVLLASAVSAGTFLSHRTAAQTTLTIFQKSGVRFTVPQGWKITDEESGEGSFYVACEKTGFGQSGLVTVVCFEETRTLDAVLDQYAGILSKSTLLKASKLHFEKTAPATYGTYKGLARRYTAKLLGMPHRGTMTAFHAYGLSIVVVEQEAEEDAETNAAGFRALAESFRVMQ